LNIEKLPAFGKGFRYARNSFPRLLGWDRSRARLLWLMCAWRHFTSKAFF